MITDRPHTITLKWQEPTNYDDSKGIEVSGGTSSTTLQCRAVPSGRDFYQGPNKGYIRLNFEVFAGPTDMNIPEGAKAILFDKRYTVIQIVQGQLGTKIWISNDRNAGL